MGGMGDSVQALARFPLLPTLCVLNIDGRRSEVAVCQLKARPIMGEIRMRLLPNKGSDTTEEKGTKNARFLQFRPHKYAMAGRGVSCPLKAPTTLVEADFVVLLIAI